MTPQTAELVKKGMEAGKKFKGMKLLGADFTGLNLTNADFRGCGLAKSTFKGCNLTFANFEGANCYGCIYTDAILHRTNFKDANLSDTLMDCKDMFGVTITMECKSFKGMQLSPGWWAGFLYYALLMVPPNDAARDKVIQAMGVERWEVLRNQYANRMI